MVRLGLLLLAAMCFSNAIGAVETEAAAGVYEKAGIRAQVRSSLPTMPARIQEMFAGDAKTPLTPDQTAAIKKAAERAFRIDVFEPPALAELARRLDAATANKASAFLQSDLGRKMVAADENMAGLDEATLDRIMKGELKAPSSPQRDELTQKLERASRSTESTVQIFMSLGRAVAIGTAIGTGADPIAVEERARKTAESSRESMEKGLREPLRRYLAYGYRDLSDSDLKRLLAFLESAAGSSYLTAYTGAIAAGYDAMGKRCGELLGGSLREIAQTQAQAARSAAPGR